MKLNSNRPDAGKRKFVLYIVYNQPPELSIGQAVGLKTRDIYMNNKNICSFISAK